VVGARESPSVPLRGSIIDVSDIGGGRSRVSVSASQGAAIDVCHAFAASGAHYHFSCQVKNSN
jgi:hypothetical protein